MKKIVIAIDGHSGCGKSTTAKLVANRLNYIFIDTGAMYRAVSLYFLQNGIPFLSENPQITEALKNIRIQFRIDPETEKIATFLNGKNVESEIRTMEISGMVSEVAALKSVRMALVAQQREMGKEGGVVMDGRDIGTVVFPDAELKIFMNADLEERVQRRLREIKERGKEASADNVRNNLLHRDHIDSTRAEAPLRRAEDAILLDTSHRTIEEQVNFVLDHVGSIVFGEKEGQLENLT